MSRSITSTLQKVSATLDRDLTDLRQRVQETKDEIEWIGSAPPLKDEAIKRVDAAVDCAASKFDFSGSARDLLDGNGIGDLLKVTSNAQVVVDDGFGVAKVSQDLGPMLAWLLTDALKMRLCTAIEELNYEAGPPADERPALLAGARERLHSLEAEEENLISDAENAGMDVQRRADADPAIILNAHSVHVYRFKISPVHGEYFHGEIESAEPLKRSDIKARARHALPRAWLDAHEIERIEIIGDQSDVIDGDEPDPEDGPRHTVVRECKTRHPSISDELKAGKRRALGDPDKTT